DSDDELNGSEKQFKAEEAKDDELVFFGLKTNNNGWDELDENNNNNYNEENNDLNNALRRAEELKIIQIMIQSL
ncbi:18941_t:CDS:2, partial [Funneliformis geosporum]